MGNIYPSFIIFGLLNISRLSEVLRYLNVKTKNFELESNFTVEFAYVSSELYRIGYSMVVFDKTRPISVSKPTGVFIHSTASHLNRTRICSFERSSVEKETFESVSGR